MGTMPTQARLIRERLQELRAKRGLSRSKLSRLTVTTGYEGVGEGTIKAYETEPGRIPGLGILEALAGALEVDAQEFYEYPISAARAGLAPEDMVQALDEADPPSEQPRSSSGEDESPPAREDEAS